MHCGIGKVVFVDVIVKCMRGEISEPVKSVSFRYAKKVAHLSVSGAAEMACRRNQVKVSGGDILEVRKRSKEDHCQDQEYTFWLTSHVNWNGVSL